MLINMRLAEMGYKNMSPENEHLLPDEILPWDDVPADIAIMNKLGDVNEEIEDTPIKSPLPVYVRAYNTHYELINYEMEDCPRIEKDFRTWDKLTYKFNPYYYYDEARKVLYIPRGYSEAIVSDQTGRPVEKYETGKPKTSVNFTMKSLPRDDYQAKMIRFLIGDTEFRYLKNAHQQVLTIPTRSGKTFCTIAAIAALHVKALIIVNRDMLREQWASEITQHSNLPMTHICLIKESEFFNPDEKKDSRKFRFKYIFITTHRTIHNAIERYGIAAIQHTVEYLDIGVKVIDEAHLEFRNTLMTDYAVNVWKNFYLTATFARSDAQENFIFQKAFNHVAKIAEKNPERQKSVKLFMIGFRTKPSYIENQMICYRKTGFSRHSYIKYELERPDLDRVVMMILDTLINKKRIEGKILLLSSQTTSCDYFEEVIHDYFPSYSVCSHHSKHPVENFRDYGIICATPGMVGTGTTIPKLRAVINTEPMASTVNTIQIFGRLDVYAPGFDTFYFLVSDLGFDKVARMFSKSKQTLAPHAKEIIEWNIGGQRK